MNREIKLNDKKVIKIKDGYGLYIQKDMVYGVMDEQVLAYKYITGERSLNNWIKKLGFAI